MTGYLACCAQMRQNISLVEACADHHFDMVRAILTVTNPWPTFTSFSHSGQALCYVCKDGMLLLDVRRTWQIEWVYLGICPCEVLAKSVKARFLYTSSLLLPLYCGQDRHLKWKYKRSTTNSPKGGPKDSLATRVSNVSHGSCKVLVDIKLCISIVCEFYCRC